MIDAMHEKNRFDSPLHLEIVTHERVSFINITSKVSDYVRKSGKSDGVCTVFVPHTTAGITINEAADPSVIHDINKRLDALVPEDGDYRHAEGNSDAHIKASLMGSSVHIPISSGRLLLGIWQGIFFCEFDGPRARTCIVRISE